MCVWVSAVGRLIAPHCVTFSAVYIAQCALVRLKSVVRVSCVVAHAWATTQLLSDKMSFKLLKPTHTNTKEDKPKQHGTTSERAASSPKQKKSKVTPLCHRLDICIYKVTDRASDCWRRFEGSGVPLWQVLV